MAENTTTGTPAGDDGDARSTATTGTPGSDGGNAGLTEAERQELERLRQAHAQALAEKEGRAQEQKRLADVEAENERLRRAIVPPNATDPLETEIRELMAQAQQFPNDPVVKRALRTAAEEYQRRIREAEIAAARPAFAAMPKEIQELAWGFFTSGQAIDAAAAQLQAEGVLARKKGTETAEQERARREADERLAREAAEKPTTSVVSVGADLAKTREMDPEEYARRVAGGDRQLMLAAERGQVKFKTR